MLQSSKMWTALANSTVRANMAGYVVNQSLFGKGYALDVLKDNDWGDLIGTNLNGVNNSVRAELNHMKGHGSIVNAARIASQYGPEFNAHYFVAKWESLD